MRIFILPDRFVVERDPNQEGPHLQIWRQTGKAEAVHTRLDPRQVIQATSHYTFGIVGAVELLAGRYLIHVSDAKIVSSLLGHAVYEVLSVGILPFSSHRLEDHLPEKLARDQEAIYLDMIKAVLRSSSFHFSYTLDLTHTIQRISGLGRSKLSRAQAPNLAAAADPRFFWNRSLCAEYLSLSLDPCFLVLVSGFFRCVHVKANCVEFHYALFSRRSARNAGRRFTRRGVDQNGDPVNFAEQEQIVVVSRPDGVQDVAAFVQTRGSVPFLWSQPACLKWAPPLHIHSNAESRALLDKHLSEHAQTYGPTVLVNLVNQTGKEARIASALTDMVPAYSPKTAELYTLVSFDFHKECKKMKYERIGLLLDQVQDQVQSMAYFHGLLQPDGKWIVQRQQVGCIRTNCMDCLDRTNVVQCAIAKAVLVEQLKTCSVVNGGSVDDHEFLRSSFQNIWADNADSMSMLYAGTKALKTDYTRTGKRSVMGACSDGKSSITRFFLNNFRDGYAQDALDLFLGNYKLDPIRKMQDLPYSKAQNDDGISSLVNFVLSKSLMIFVSTMITTLTMPASMRPSLSTVLTLSVLIGPVISLALAQRNGRRFVDKPKLLPLAGILFAEDGETKRSRSSLLLNLSSLSTVLVLGFEVTIEMKQSR